MTPVATVVDSRREPSDQRATRSPRGSSATRVIETLSPQTSRERVEASPSDARVVVPHLVVCSAESPGQSCPLDADIHFTRSDATWCTHITS
jgi:hypothetical protein